MLGCSDVSFYLEIQTKMISQKREQYFSQERHCPFWLRLVRNILTIFRRSSTYIQKIQTNNTLCAGAWEEKNDWELGITEKEF